MESSCPTVTGRSHQHAEDVASPRKLVRIPRPNFRLLADGSCELIYRDGVRVHCAGGSFVAALDDLVVIHRPVGPHSPTVEARHARAMIRGLLAGRRS